jgi:hypothetical protein
MSGEYLPKGVSSKHATDDALELYALKLLKGRGLEAIEEHLLTCQLCRMTLTSVDQEIARLRTGLRYIELKKREAALREKMTSGNILMFKAPINS